MTRVNPKKREEPVNRNKEQELKAEATKQMPPEQMEEEGVGEVPKREPV